MAVASLLDVGFRGSARVTCAVISEGKGKPLFLFVLSGHFPSAYLLLHTCTGWQARCRAVVALGRPWWRDMVSALEESWCQWERERIVLCVLGWRWVRCVPRAPHSAGWMRVERDEIRKISQKSHQVLKKE